MPSQDGISVAADRGVTARTEMTRLQKVRGMSGLTRRDVAARVGATPLEVGRWERGSARPASVQLEKLSELYGVSGVYLMEDN